MTTATMVGAATRNERMEQFVYDDAIVRLFLLATLVWGFVGMLVGIVIALELANPVFNLGLPWISFGRLRPLHTNAVIFAFAGNAIFTGGLLLDPAPAQGADVERPAEPPALLGLAGHHRVGRHHPAARHHPVQGVRGAGVADRRGDRPGVGGLLGQRLRHHRAPARAAPLRGDLVLHLDPGGHRGAAHLQQPGGRGRALQELLDLRGRAGRVHAVVVRAQRGGLLPDHPVPRDDVLLPPQGGRPADLLLPALDPALLDDRVPLHLGGPAPPALHRAARVGLDPRDALLGDAVDALLGRHGQRPADPARAPGTR